MKIARTPVQLDDARKNRFRDVNVCTYLHRRFLARK